MKSKLIGIKKDLERIIDDLEYAVSHLDSDHYGYDDIVSGGRIESALEELTRLSKIEMYKNCDISYYNIESCYEFMKSNDIFYGDFAIKIVICEGLLRISKSILEDINNMLGIKDCL